MRNWYQFFTIKKNGHQLCDRIIDWQSDKNDLTPKLTCMF